MTKERLEQQILDLLINSSDLYNLTVREIANYIFSERVFNGYRIASKSEMQRVRYALYQLEKQRKVLRYKNVWAINK